MARRGGGASRLASDACHHLPVEPTWDRRLGGGEREGIGGTLQRGEFVAADRAGREMRAQCLDLRGLERPEHIGGDVGAAVRALALVELAHAVTSAGSPRVNRIFVNP